MYFLHQQPSRIAYILVKLYMLKTLLGISESYCVTVDDRSMICCCEPANDVFLSIDRWVLGLSVYTGAVGEASYFGGEVGIAEEGDGLASRGDGLGFAYLFGRRRNNAMQSRAENIVTPAGEQVSNVDDNGIRLSMVQ